MSINFDSDISDDAADTLRLVRFDFDDEAPTDSDATSIWALAPTPVPRVSVRRRRQIRDTRDNLLRLREALAAGWDIAPELAHEERCLSSLMTANQ